MDQPLHSISTRYMCIHVIEYTCVHSTYNNNTKEIQHCILLAYSKAVLERQT